MADTRVVVELLSTDESGPKLLTGFMQSFSALSLSCSIESKQQFEIARSIEEGASKLFEQARMYENPWCVYVAPRRMDIVIDGSPAASVNGALIAITRRRKPAAFFLQTITETGMSNEIAEALESLIDKIRSSYLSHVVTRKEEPVIGLFHKAILGGYVQAFSGKDRLN